MYILSVWKKLFFGPRVTEPESAFTPTDKEFNAVGTELKEKINTLFGGRSLRIRAVDGGSANGEEIELTALNNAYYDIERFGLSFVASPRHADILMVTGPVTRNLAHAVKDTYDSTPEPRIVIAVGDGAATGGIWKDSYAVVGPVSNVIPVDHTIPGDPPTPTEMLRGILAALTHHEGASRS